MKNLTAREGALQSNGQGTTGEQPLACYPKRKAAHCGSEAGNGLRNEMVTPFREDKHWELRHPTDDSAKRHCDKRIKIGAVKGLDVVPCCHEKSRAAAKEP